MDEFALRAVSVAVTHATSVVDGIRADTPGRNLRGSS